MGLADWWKTLFPPKVKPDPIPPPVVAPILPPTVHSPDFVHLLVLHNEARRDRGRGMLAWERRLARAAQLHAEDVARRGWDSHPHRGSDGSDVGERIQRQGYVFRFAAENSAPHLAGSSLPDTPETVMREWMNSPGHKANILDARGQEFGAGYARHVSGETIWITVFAAPAS